MLNAGGAVPVIGKPIICFVLVDANRLIRIQCEGVWELTTWKCNFRVIEGAPEAFKVDALVCVYAPRTNVIDNSHTTSKCSELVNFLEVFY